MIRSIFCFLLGILFIGCTQHARRPSPEITYQDDFVLYKGKKFTGVLEERFDHVGVLRKTEYKDGLQNGLEEDITFSGQTIARRPYHQGQKVGLHEGWYEGGQRRYQHEYRASKNHGDVFEWYASGKLATYAKFENGRLLGKKMWRESGQIYMNYVFPEKKVFGLPGTKLCYQVRKNQSP